MSQEASLQLVREGKSNVLQICRGAQAGLRSVVVDCCKDLPEDDADADRLNRLKSRFHSSHLTGVHQSTDFVCSYSNCAYHHNLESKYILHARSHFNYEVAPDALYDAVFRYSNQKYTCSKCPRSTIDWISFREHIRHHIFESPYRCSKCLVLISSVPALRMHFMRYHAGKNADFVFSCGVHDFNSLLTLLLPEPLTVRESLEICLKLPGDISSRTSRRSMSAESVPVYLVKELLCDKQWQDQWQDQQDELSCSDRFDDPPVLNIIPGKYEYTYGLYKCSACCYTTSKEEAFARHAWNHVHRFRGSICAHNTSGKLSSECAVVSGLIGMLKRVALNETVDMLRKQTTVKTQVQARRQASEVLENGSSVVSDGNSKSFLRNFSQSIQSMHLNLNSHGTA